MKSTGEIAWWNGQLRQIHRLTENRQDEYTSPNKVRAKQKAAIAESKNELYFYWTTLRISIHSVFPFIRIGIVQVHCSILSIQLRVRDGRRGSRPACRRSDTGQRRPLG